MSSSANEPKKKDEHRGLRMMVIGMGILLVLGTILLIGLVIQKAAAPKPVPTQDPIVAAAPPAPSTPQVPDIACGMAPLDVRGKGRIVALEIDEQRVHVLTQPAGAASAIITLNRCTGEIISQQTIVGDDTDAPASPPTPASGQ